MAENNNGPGAIQLLFGPLSAVGLSLLTDKFIQTMSISYYMFTSISCTLLFNGACSSCRR